MDEISELLQLTLSKILAERKNEIEKWSIISSHTLIDIVEERKRQNEKWGEQNHKPLIWCAILGEEVGEVNKALIESPNYSIPPKEYLKELIHVAAVAIAAYESGIRQVNEYIETAHKNIKIKPNK